MKLSIVTINRNKADGLRRTLESTFDAQPGFDDWEQIVVDGASTDGSIAVLDKWKDDKHFGWHVSEPDRGIYNAMNKGAAHASGDYLLFLNSGDELLPNVLEKVFRNASDADIVYGDELVIGNNGKSWKWTVLPDDLTSAFFLLSGFPHQACFVSRSLFFRMNGYDEALHIVGDTEFLLRCRLNPEVRFMRLPIVVAKFYKDGVSSNPAHQAERLNERRRVMAVHFGSFASNVAASLLSADKPWISGRVAMLAANDRSLARFLRTFAGVSSRLWSYRLPRFFMDVSARVVNRLKRLRDRNHNKGNMRLRNG